MKAWRNRLTVLISLPLAIGAFAAAAEQPRAPEGVRKLLETKGGQETVRLLFEEDKAWEALLQGVVSGKREWLAVAQQLRPFTDAHASETLDMAVEEALVSAPGPVLSIFGPDACRGVGFADQEAESLAQVQGEIAKRRRALKAVTGSGLASAKKECMRLLDETEASAPSWQWPSKE